MSILGIDAITYHSLDLPSSQRFFEDFGLQLMASTEAGLSFATRNGAQIKVFSPASSQFLMHQASSLVEVTWGVADKAALHRLATSLRDHDGFFAGNDYIRCLDPNKLALRFQLRTRLDDARPARAKRGAGGHQAQPKRVRAFRRARPLDIEHIAFHVAQPRETADFYSQKLGFSLFGHYPEQAVFLRGARHGKRYDLLFLQASPPEQGLSHVSFTVHTRAQIINGGRHMEQRGWHTTLGPVRHPVSAAIFWYFSNPSGALANYYYPGDSSHGPAAVNERSRPLLRHLPYSG